MSLHFNQSQVGSLVELLFVFENEGHWCSGNYTVQIKPELAACKASTLNPLLSLRPQVGRLKDHEP